MAKVDQAVKEAILSLSKNELEKLVLKAAQKSKEFHDFLFANYTNQEFAREELFEAAKADLDHLFTKSYRSYSEELQMAKMLSACHKRINQFEKVCKDKKQVLQLVMYVLEIPFSLNTNMFCTCFTAYNHKVFLLVRKSISLLKKIHEDFWIEYVPKINEYLIVLHRTSRHLDYIYFLPKSI
ncbi:MAG: hypothetical protein SH818_12780 [Saprospiraceae bacterium]|nr:hypothetical protein [Saprospiraceae bacterium]